MLNHVTIAGRLTKSPEMRTTQSGKNVTSFTVAVDRDYQQGGERKVDFVNCFIWGNGANFVSTYFGKGSMILVSGRLESRIWTDKNDNKRTEWEINADHVYFGGDKKQDGENTYKSPQAQNVSAAEFEELGDSDSDEGLPF